MVIELVERLYGNPPLAITDPGCKIKDDSGADDGPSDAGEGHGADIDDGHDSDTDDTDGIPLMCESSL